MKKKGESKEIHVACREHLEDDSMEAVGGQNRTHPQRTKVTESPKMTLFTMATLYLWKPSKYELKHTNGLWGVLYSLQERLLENYDGHQKHIV